MWNSLCIGDIDGRNGKSGGRVLLQASVLKSEVCDWNILIENKNAIDISHDMSICITFANHLELIQSELDSGFYPLASPTTLI